MSPEQAREEERVRCEKIILNMIKRHADEVGKVAMLKGILKRIKNVPKQKAA